MKKTITIINPKCLKCSKRNDCNNKTFMFAWIDEDECNDYKEAKTTIDIAQNLSIPAKLTSEMIQKEITKQLLNKELDISVGIDFGKGYSKQSKYINR